MLWIKKVHEERVHRKEHYGFHHTEILAIPHSNSTNGILFEIHDERDNRGPKEVCFQGEIICHEKYITLNVTCLHWIPLTCRKTKVTVKIQSLIFFLLHETVVLLSRKTDKLQFKVNTRSCSF